MRVSNVTTMTFEEVCEEFEKTSMPTEADVKTIVEELSHLLACRLSSGMKSLSKWMEHTCLCTNQGFSYL